MSIMSGKKLTWVLQKQFRDTWKLSKSESTLKMYVATLSDTRNFLFIGLYISKWVPPRLEKQMPQSLLLIFLLIETVLFYYLASSTW